jgi:glutathione S-transferase
MAFSAKVAVSIVKETPHMKLIGSLTSPFVRKIRIMLAEKALPYEFVTEDVWSAASDIQSLNPLGKVPSLVLDDGRAVFDSSVIVEVLEGLQPAPPLLPTDWSARCDARVLEAIGDGIADAAVAMLLEARFHPADHKSQAWIDRQIGKLMVSCAYLDRLLLKSASGYLGARLAIGDIAVVSGLAYTAFRFPSVPWRAEFGALAAYVDRLEQRASFLATKLPE